MGDFNCSNPYESDTLAEATGKTLRPGGFELTDIGVQYCGLPPNAAVLDLGCGRGATVDYLAAKYGITAVGLDPSEKLVETAQRCYTDARFVVGRGDCLPFGDGLFDAVLAECTLSLMDRPDDVLSEVHRVLKDNGWLIITDVYAKNPEALSGLVCYPSGGCLSGMHDLSLLSGRLNRAGFSVEERQDHSGHMTALMVKIIFAHGSIREFWKTASGGVDGGDGYDKAVGKCKPGYFLMIARKQGNTA